MDSVMDSMNVSPYNIGKALFCVPLGIFVGGLGGVIGMTVGFVMGLVGKNIGN
jgi:hypothetical protein